MNIVLIDIVRQMYWNDRENLDLLEICKYLSLKNNISLKQYNINYINEKKIAEQISRELNPDILLYNLDFNADESVISCILNICYYIKEINNSMINVIIGYRALVNKEKLKNKNNIDYVFYESPVEIAKKIYKIDYCREDIDIQNMFNFKNVTVKRDERVLREIGKAKIRTSRGCLGNCSFCIDKDKKNKMIYRNMIDVINEIERINKDFGTVEFMIYDNSFEDPYPKDKRRIYEFIKYVKEKKWKFYFNCSVRAESFINEDDLELLKQMNQIGFYNIIVGFESGSMEDLSVFNKRATVQDNIRIAKYLEKSNINFSLVPGFIMFHPYSTVGSLKDNIEFLYKINRGFAFNAMVSSIKIIKGTEIANKVISDKLIDSEDIIKNDLICYAYKNTEIEYLARFLIKNRYNSKTVEMSSKIDMARNIISKCRMNYNLWVGLDNFIINVRENERIMAEHIKTFWESVFENINDNTVIKESFYKLESKMKLISIDLLIKDFFINNYGNINTII